MSSADPSGVSPRLPPGYATTARALAQPDFALAPGVTLEQWSSGCGSPDCSLQAISGCFATNISGYCGEVDALVHDKLAQVIAAAAARAGHDVRLREVARLEQDTLGYRDLSGDATDARSFTAFTGSPSTLHACFALSIGGGPDGRVGIEWVHHTSISGARIPAPPPAAALSGALYAVHHPRVAIGAAVAMVCLLFVAAIALRPSPRRARASRARWAD